MKKKRFGERGWKQGEKEYCDLEWVDVAKGAQLLHLLSGAQKEEERIDRFFTLPN